jgi:hypothetical protein
MERSAFALEHEEGLVLFIEPDWRTRFRSSLAQPRPRKKLLGSLYHFNHLDGRFATPVENRDQNQAWILGALVRLGAPAECHLVSSDKGVDGCQIPLAEALEEVLSDYEGTFVSCVPGRLAYFHGELSSSRFLLQPRV